MSFDAETIRTYAVNAVTDFVSNGTPLSQGIAKIASANELNSEQIKRVVEASNTVAHLKLMSGAQDRTFEFPVAKYETVLGHMVQPDSQSNEPVSEAYGSTKGTDEHTKYSMDRSQLETYTAKAMLAVKSDLENIAVDKQEILLRMEASIASMQKSQYPLEKLAEVATEKEYEILSPFLSHGLEKTASENLNTKLVFTDKDLDEARYLVSLVKEAKVLLDSELEKQAFFAAAGRALGSVVGITARYVANKIGGIAGTVGSVAAAKLAGNTTPLETAQKWDKLKARSNSVLNVAGGALTSHANGNVMEQIQR